MIWFILYVIFGIGLYAIMAKGVEQQTGRAPQMGCIAWAALVLAWPLLFSWAVVTYVDARLKRKWS